MLHLNSNPDCKRNVRVSGVCGCRNKGGCGCGGACAGRCGSEFSACNKAGKCDGSCGGSDVSGATDGEGGDVDGEGIGLDGEGDGVGLPRQVRRVSDTCYIRYFVSP